jgi:hypothetical protein
VNYSGPTVFELGEVAALKLAVKNFRKVETTLVGSQLWERNQSRWWLQW